MGTTCNNTRWKTTQFYILYQVPWILYSGIIKMRLHYLKNDFLMKEDTRAQKWISGYFTYFNNIFPVLSRPHFMLQWSHQHIDRLLLNAVYTIGSKYTDDHHQETSTYLFERCQCILNMSCDPPTLSTVQALVILCWYSYLMGNMQTCCVLRQRLNGAVQDLLLYQEPGPPLGIVDIEMHRRAFWVVFVTDQWLSCSSGRRFLALPNNDWHCQWPKLEDTQLMAIDRIEQWNDNDNDDMVHNQAHDLSTEYALQITAFSEMIKLACILDDMHKEESYQQVMVSRLTDWLLHLPSYLEYGKPKDDSPPLPIARIYHMLYYTVQIILHRPFMEEWVPTTDLASSRKHPDMARTICTNAANTIIHIAEQMIQHHHHQAHLLNTFMTSATVATWVHLDNTLAIHQTHNLSSLLGLDRSIQVLINSNSTILSSAALGQLLDRYLLDNHGICLTDDKKPTNTHNSPGTRRVSSCLTTRSDDDGPRKRRRRRQRQLSLADSSRSSSPQTSPWENTFSDDLLDTRLYSLMHSSSQAITPTSSSASSVCSRSPLNPTWLHETGTILDWFSDQPDLLYPPTESPCQSNNHYSTDYFKSTSNNLFEPPTSMDLYVFMSQY
ncbi:fungal-specific transcription factor domain-containing protein [Chlamydoabsidia padenii]|nr:fungal-specific transcription factor domain-containing protein [Chlamydoabsidia padenii]